jgi:hypothetical protein
MTTLKRLFARRLKTFGCRYDLSHQPDYRPRVRILPKYFWTCIHQLLIWRFRSQGPIFPTMLRIAQGSSCSCRLYRLEYANLLITKDGGTMLFNPGVRGFPRRHPVEAAARVAGFERPSAHLPTPMTDRCRLRPYRIAKSGVQAALVALPNPLRLNTEQAHSPWRPDLFVLIAGV